MTRQLELLERPPRAKPRKLMRVFDAGHCHEGHFVRFWCKRCGYESGWFSVPTVTEGKRGLPCPRCNGGEPVPL